MQKFKKSYCKGTGLTYIFSLPLLLKSTETCTQEEDQGTGLGHMTGKFQAECEGRWMLRSAQGLSLPSEGVKWVV